MSSKPWEVHWAFPDDIDAQRKWCASRAPDIKDDLQLDQMVSYLQNNAYGELVVLQEEYFDDSTKFHFKNRYLEIDPDSIDDILDSLEDTMSKHLIYCEIQMTRKDFNLFKLLPTIKEIEKHAVCYFPSALQDPEYQRDQHFNDVLNLYIYDICKRAKDKCTLELTLNGKPYSEEYQIIKKVKDYAQSLIE